MFIQHFFVGLLVVALGVVTLRYNFQLVGWTGNIEWIERFLGYGSTYAFLKIISVLLCIGGFMYMFGLFTPVMSWLFSPLRQFFHVSG